MLIFVFFEFNRLLYPLGCDLLFRDEFLWV